MQPKAIDHLYFFDPVIKCTNMNIIFLTPLHIRQVTLSTFYDKLKYLIKLVFPIFHRNFTKVIVNVSHFGYYVNY